VSKTLKEAMDSLEPEGVEILRFFDKNPYTMDYARGIANRLGLSENAVQRHLEHLARQGFLSVRTSSGVDRAPIYSYTRDRQVRQAVSQALAARVG